MLHRWASCVAMIVVAVACGTTALDGAPDASLQCGAGTIACGSVCAATAYDPTNCGACGNACPPNEVCFAGACSVECLGGTVQCGQSCVNLAYDPTHCGSCSTTCAPQVACLDGQCEGGCTSTSTPCPQQFTLDGGVSAKCAELDTDPLNCGACGNECQQGFVCTSGQCTCSGGKTLCLGACVDESNDPTHCGSCGVACGSNEACVSGSCTCKSGFTKCSGACVDVDASFANCGSCGVACSAGELCTDGACGKPTSAWNMFGNDAQHSGYNSAEQGSPPLTEAWATNLVPPNQTAGVHPVVADDGLVFATLDSYSYYPLTALHLDDGTQAWSYNFGSIYSVGHPSVAGGVVYVGNGQGEAGEMWAFHSLAGTAFWYTAFSVQFEHYFAPLVTTDYVYADTGYGGGISAFAVSDGTTKFFNGTIGQYDSWSAAQFGGKIFTLIAGNLRAHDPLDGSVSWTTTVTWNWNGYSMNTAPVFDANYGYVIAPPTLYAIDPSTHQIVWQQGGGYTGTPAVAGGAVFGTSGGNLIVRGTSDGSLLWTFSGDGALSYPPVIANGTVYCASSSNVYAVSISTHTQSWTAPVGGWLAVASRRLLVATSTGVLHAFLMSK